MRQLWVTTWDRQKNAPDSVGREHVVITAVERKGVSQTNLCFIQEAVRGEDVRTRGGNIMPGNAGWLMSALSDAAVASSGTRGVQVPEEDVGRANRILDEMERARQPQSNDESAEDVQ